MHMTTLGRAGVARTASKPPQGRVCNLFNPSRRSIHMAAEDRDLNRDPITDEPGAHPVGTGVGATGGAVAGAAAGTVGGPVGVAVGGVIGAVVGGLAGKAAAESVNPTAEEAHWRENYTREPYYEPGRSFDDYAPAYRLGVTGRTQYEDWNSAEPQLASEWESARGGSSLSWPEAQRASRAAWDRIDANYGSGMPGMDGSRDSMTGDPDTDNLGQRTMGGQSQSQSQDSGYIGSTGGGAAAAVGAAQSAGNTLGDTDDVIDALNDLLECSRDGEKGFRACAEHAKREDLKSLFMQRADDCRGAVQELTEQIRSLGGEAKDSGSAMGALQRGWLSVKSALTSQDDKAMLEECERGEDNAVARYRKALKQPLPAGVKLIVERQMQGVQRNHDQIKMLRDQFRAA
jgi:uncharacterized protein (TIGR02284 family)